MVLPRPLLTLVLAFSLSASARAGLHYSGESLADLPSQWRGFLIDLRSLRSVALKPGPGGRPSPAREHDQAEADRLTKAARERALTPDEAADLGALWVRLGEAGKALEVLRRAQRDHPNHYRIISNLGTAWQLQGDLRQAESSLQEAVRLAPGKYQKAEEYQLKLVRFRQRRAGAAGELDDLFGVRYVNDRGAYEPGQLAAAERKKLPEGAAAVLQQLALWLPGDGPLLWQLAELSAGFGDVRTAAAIMDGCVTEYGLSSAELREHRRLMRAAADELARKSPAGAKAAHEGHVGGLAPRSKRPLQTRFDQAPLPPIDDKGVNPLPWSVVTETALDRQARPTFARYLRELDGKRVAVRGFMQPLGDDTDLGAFMLVEYPVGCWYCEMPDLTGILLVELPSGQTATFSRGRVRITGKLTLNASDPENFLYTVSQAKVVEEE